MRTAAGPDSVPRTKLLVRPWNEPENPLRVVRQMGRTRAAEVSSDEGFLFAAELLVSELVTNALTHGADDDQPVFVEFPSSPWSWKVRVLDPSPQPPREVVAYDDDVSGRGLVLVHHFASQYNGHLDVEITGDGKAVTCTLPIPAPNRVAEEARA